MRRTLFSLVLALGDGKWLIINHHSSAMPEVDAPKVAKVK